MKKHEHDYGPVVPNVEPDNVQYEECDKCGSKIASNVPVESRCRICGKKES